MFDNYGSVRFWIGFLTLELYYPKIDNNGANWYLHLDTIIIFHKYLVSRE